MVRGKKRIAVIYLFAGGFTRRQVAAVLGLKARDVDAVLRGRFLEGLAMMRKAILAGKAVR